MRLRAAKLKEAISAAVNVLLKRLILVAPEEGGMEVVEGWADLAGGGFQERLVRSCFFFFFSCLVLSGIFVHLCSLEVFFFVLFLSVNAFGACASIYF